MKWCNVLVCLGLALSAVYPVFSYLPTGRNRLKQESPRMNRLIRFSLVLAIAGLVLSLTMAGSASATTYYIAANGSDTNNGTSKTSPWLHAPGMKTCVNICASANPQPGDQFIFRGGDTWHWGNSSASPYVGSNGWNWNWSGSSGNPIYIGVDQSWFSGGSWTRPVLSGDNPLWSGSGFPGSCGYPIGNNMVSLGSGSESYTTFDNFEFSGTCWTGQSGSNGAMMNIPGGDTNMIISNIYCHGWTMTSDASDNFPCFTSFGGGTVDDQNQYVGIVVAGSDSPHFPAGSSNCKWVSNDPAGCASGQGFNGSHFWDLHDSVVRYVSNMMVTSNCHTIHDNLFEYLYDSFASGSLQQHPNVMNCLGGATGDPLYWYNNVMRNTYSTENVYFAVRTTIYFFNNVMYNNMNSTVGLVAGGCIRMNNVSNSSQPTTAYIYNNTWGDATCQIKFEVANSPLTAWSGVGNFQNNHVIGFLPSVLNSIYICATSETCTIKDNGNEVFQTTAAASSQGYTASNNFAPTQANGATIGAGANLSESCGVSSTNNALCSGTSEGALEQSGSGGEIASNPAIPLVQRGSSWNAVAYQFGSAG